MESNTTAGTWLAALVDGPGERPPTRRAARGAVPSVPGELGNVEPVAEDNPEARRQHMGPRRRVHHRTQLHAFAEKGPSGQRSGRPDPKRRPHSPSRRLRGTTTILRVHLPKALEVPQSIARINAGKPPTVSSDEATIFSLARPWTPVLLRRRAESSPYSVQSLRPGRAPSSCR